MLMALVGIAVAAAFISTILAPPEINRESRERRPPFKTFQGDDGRQIQIVIRDPKKQ